MFINTAIADEIELPAPEKTGGLSVNHALAERKSVRDFDPDRSLSLQTISNLLWATCGVNRPEDDHRTNPTAMNRQEIDAYWFDTNGVYLYDFKGNKLIPVVEGDKRSLLAGTPEFSQDFVMDAPGAVLIVIDTTKSGSDERAMFMASIDAGIASENLSIFCAGNGLATVPRASMDVAGICKILSLPETSIPAINNPVGYPKK
ncbi:MAG: SagB/ThcOx family dehydrogenase [Muribaculaceae bacterium]|nr:SagB/ThcOx family dehydrogenase [Muribaculaceae bacterium]